MEEWVFLFDLLFRYLEQCQKTWEALQKLQGRINCPECRQKFVETVTPGIHRYVVHLHKLALKQLERDGETFVMKRWVSENSSILEEFDVPLNRLKLKEIKGGIQLDLRYPHQVSLVEDTDLDVLYDCNSLISSAKRVRFNMVAVEVLPELVPDLPQAVVICEESSQDAEIVINPFYFQM